MALTDKLRQNKRRNNNSCEIYLCTKIKDFKVFQNKETAFVYIFGFIFYGVSRAKTDLHNKYMFNIVPGSCFEQDNPLNSIILGVHAKR